MKILKLWFVITQVAVLSLIISCSSSEDPGEKSVLKEKQDQITEKVTTSIKTPIEKAEMVNELMNERIQQIEEDQNE
ncbi:MAG: hypothetical protein ACI8ZB_003161 [Desulforhopalus sp.]|jgi:hypothetical protein